MHSFKSSGTPNTGFHRLDYPIHPNAKHLQNNINTQIARIRRMVVPDPSHFILKKDEYAPYGTALKNSSSILYYINTLEGMLDKNLYPNLFIMSLFIKLFRNEFFSTAFQLYQLVTETGRADSSIYNNFIDSAGKTGLVDLVVQAFNEAQLYSCADIITFNNFIHVVGMNGRIDLAEQAFNQAINSGIANESTCGSCIKVAGKNRRVDLAIRALNEAKRLGCVNAIIYCNYIDATGRNGRSDLAEKGYEEAETLGFVNDILSKNLVTAFVINKRFTAAEKIYTENKMEICKKEFNGKLHFDLHNHSYGSAFIGLRFLLLNLPPSSEELITLYVLVGKGLHSNEFAFNEKGEHRTRQAVIDIGNEFKELVKIAEDKNDPAWLMMQVKNPAPIPSESKENQFDDYMRSISDNYDSSNQLHSEWKQSVDQSTSIIVPTVQHVGLFLARAEGSSNSTVSREAEGPRVR